jgi:PKHD-type hydroxylase
MKLDTYYYYFQSLFSKKICENIIDLGLQKIQKNKQLGISSAAVTFGGSEKKNDDRIALGEKTIEQLALEKNKTNEEIKDKIYIRDSEVSWLNEQWLYDLVKPYVIKANIKAGWNYQIDSSESFQFTVYNPGGFYGWHSDGQSDYNGRYTRNIPGVTNNLFSTNNVDYIGKIRKISLTINLNCPGDYEGGNLKFDFGPHSEKNRYHECIEIRPQGSMVVFPSFVDHTVTPVLKGTRYSLVLWMLGFPFK